MLDAIVNPGIPEALSLGCRSDVIFGMVNVCFVTHQEPHEVISELDSLLDIDESERAEKFQAIVAKLSVNAEASGVSRADDASEGTIIL